MEEMNNYSGKLSDLELENLKIKHKKVAILEVPVDDSHTKIAVCYLKPLDRMLLSAVLSTQDKVKQVELLLDGLWLAGDERIKTEDELFFTAMPEVLRMMAFREAVLKKN